MLLLRGRNFFHGYLNFENRNFVLFGNSSTVHFENQRCNVCFVNGCNTKTTCTNVLYVCIWQSEAKEKSVSSSWYISVLEL